MTTAPAAQQTAAPLAADVIALIARQAAQALTHCRICGMELRQEDSVALGIGPHCRRKYAPKRLMDAVRKDLRPLVKAAIRSLSANTGTTRADALAIVPELSILRSLGFAILADAVEKRMAIVEITYTEAGAIEVRHQRSDTLWNALRAIPGSARVKGKDGRWAHIMLAERRGDLARVLEAVMPGQLGWSNKGGLFQVVAGSKRWTLARQLTEAELDATMAALDKACTILAQSPRDDVRAHGEAMLFSGFAAAVAPMPTAA